MRISACLVPRPAAAGVRPRARHSQPTSTAPGRPSSATAGYFSRSARRPRTRRRPWNGDWNMGQTFPIDELQRPARQQTTNSRASAIKFELRREAGTLAFDGAFRDGRGAGLFAFTPRPEYIAEMKRLGYNDDLPLWRRYQLAVHDVGPKYIRALKTEGLRQADARRDSAREDPRRHDRIHPRHQGPGLSRVDARERSSERATTASRRITSRDEGGGLHGRNARRVRRLRDHGVTPAYVQEMKHAGFSNATLEDLVRARDHGVTAEFVQEMRGLGLSASDARRLHPSAGPRRPRGSSSTT